MSGSSTCLRPLCWTTVNAQEALQSTACWNGGLTPRPLETRSAPPVFKCEILCDYIKKLKSLLTTILLDHFPFFIFPFYLLFGLTNTAWYRTFSNRPKSSYSCYLMFYCCPYFSPVWGCVYFRSVLSKTGFGACLLTAKHFDVFLCQ